MRVAFVSFEFPPDTCDGGIATYVRQAATMLAKRGHRVSVFSATPQEDTARRETEAGVEAFRVYTPNRYEFAERVAPAFADEHQREPFDVVETPDFMADGRVIAEAHPELPLVMKLHTCSQILREVGREIPLWAYTKGWVKAGLTMTRPWWMRLPMERIEREHAGRADVVAAPSASIADRTRELWRLPRAPELMPNPFEVDERFLDIPVETETRRVLFVGRLEARKGVYELARAIRQLHRKHPDWAFRFVGHAHPWDREKVVALAGPAAAAMEFVGKVPHAELPRQLADADVSVIPSRWENFPTVCLEAMAAARGIVGSRFGGMAEMLEHGRHGLLVDPSQPKSIAAALGELMSDPARRMALGRAARTRVRQQYNADSVVQRQEAVYRQAIESRSRRLRKPNAAPEQAAIGMEVSCTA
ncbi:MAG: glycosyltransferase family 4 protein [Planctomycetota bacterium]